MGPGALSDVLQNLRTSSHPNLLIGLDVSDDAAVYKLTDDTALVQTVDFFTPIVDDPYTYGAIAAANAMSDVYAMGGRPVLALAVAAFPGNLPVEMIQAIMQGGADKVAEAGAVLAGGHTIVDKEPKYGLCVTGLIEPANIMPKANARPGDVLLLTRPLGSGIITTAMMRDLCRPEDLAAAVASMLQLNKTAAELAATVPVHSATDITGFGLLGHAAEIARNSAVGMCIDVTTVPLLPGTATYARDGIAPGGMFNNREFLEQDDYVTYAAAVEEWQKYVLFDPQTSGGLLLALPPDAAPILEQAYARAGQFCQRIGTVVAGSGIEIVRTDA